MSGLEILTRMKEIKPELKGIFLSGYLEESEISKIKEIGITKYYMKPYSLNALITAVEEFAFG